MPEPKDITQLTGRELLVRIAINQEHMVTQLDDVGKSHASLRAFVYGNGQPGLADQVREAQRWIASINRVTWAITIPLVLSVVGFLVGLLTNRIDVVIH